VSRRFVLVVSTPPAEGPDECLELALSAAAMEVEFEILFRGAGRAHLEGVWIQPWLQFPEFGLAGLWFETGEGFSGPEPEVPVRALDEESRREMFHDRTVLVL